MWVRWRSVADPGCLSRVRFFSSRIPDTGLTRSRIQIRIKKFKYHIFYPEMKKLILSSQIRSGMFIPDPWLRILDLEFLPSRIPVPYPGSRGEKTGSRIRNTVSIVAVWIRKYFFKIRICGSVILNYGSGFRRPNNNWSGVSCSGFNLNIFVAIEKKMICQIGTIVP